MRNRALAIIEYDERGTPGHDAFAAYARGLIQPMADHLGWEATPQETPDVGELRDTLLRDLGNWDDQATIAEARTTRGRGDICAAAHARQERQGRHIHASLLISAIRSSRLRRNRARFPRW